MEAQSTPLGTFKEAASFLRNAFPIVDVNINHNEFLDAHDAAKQEGKITSPDTIIHLDTHSDLFRGNDLGHSIASFLNKMVGTHGTDTIYWVLPDATLSKENRHTFWNQSEEKHKSYSDIFLNNPDVSYGYRSKTPEESGFYFIAFETYERGKDNQLHRIKPEIVNEAPNDFDTITIHKIPQSKLMTIPITGNVAVSLDGDYFSNSGNDTTQNLSFSFNRANAEQTIITLANSLKTAIDTSNATPSLFSMSISPAYSNDVRTTKLLYEILGEKHDFMLAGPHSPLAHQKTSTLPPGTDGFFPSVVNSETDQVIAAVQQAIRTSEQKLTKQSEQNSEIISKEAIPAIAEKTSTILNEKLDSKKYSADDIELFLKNAADDNGDINLSAILLSAQFTGKLNVPGIAP